MKENVFVRYGIITVACAAYALGFNWCFAANHISVGGFTGIAQIINFFLPWAPVGTMTLLMNIPLFLIGWKIFGRRLLISALYAMSVTSVFIDLFGAIIHFRSMDPILAAIYGGIIVGGAAGVMMLQDADFAFVPGDAILKDRFSNVCKCGEGAVADVIYEKIPEILNLDLDKRG